MADEPPPRPGWRSVFHKFVAASNETQRFYERRQTLITVTATLASCLAAWWTYTSRVIHQRALEEQLRRIQEDLEKSAHFRTSAIAAELEKSKELQAEANAPTKVEWAIAGIGGTFLLGYAAGFRHGRYGRWRLPSARSAPADRPPSTPS
jgi:hypothetical protein